MKHGLTYMTAIRKGLLIVKNEEEKVYKSGAVNKKSFRKWIYGKYRVLLLLKNKN